MALLVSAPAKCILFGEHAVVHGTSAIAASISLRAYLLVAARPPGSAVQLLVPDLGLNLAWPVDSLPWSQVPVARGLAAVAAGSSGGASKPTTAGSSSASKPTLAASSSGASKPTTAGSTTTTTACKPTTAGSTTTTAASTTTAKASTAPSAVPSALHPPLVRALESLLAGTDPNHFSTAFAFLYLYLHLASRSSPAAFLVRSTIPLGAGLGSSAAFSVCLAAALLFANGHIARPCTGPPSPAARILIDEWAFLGECCLHGNPSGIDNAICTAGGAILFKKGASGEKPRKTFIPDFPSIPLILTNTFQSRQTAKLVAKVAALRDSHPSVVAPVFNAIDATVTQAYQLLTTSQTDLTADRTSWTARLGQLIDINHGLLVSLGVSHPKLEKVKEVAHKGNVGWTKLTGAGGGGCAITVLRDGVTREALRVLEGKFLIEGFEMFEVVLGDKGVAVHGAYTPITEAAFLGAKTHKDLLALLSTEHKPLNFTDGSWDDIIPIPQEDDPHSIAEIAYTQEYKQGMSYLRAIMEKEEFSDRALDLTEYIIAMNPAHYTVWAYRANILFASNEDLRDELKYIEPWAERFSKNYQIWHHRQTIIKNLRDPSGELGFTATILKKDPKNYHIWTYRQWVIQEFSLWEDELEFIEKLLEEDVRNNSAWNHRFYTTFFRQDKLPENAIIQREIDYAKASIPIAPQNPCPWNYLRGIFEKTGTPLTELESLCRPYVPEDNGQECLVSPQAMDLYADICVIQKNIQKAQLIYDLLARLYDPIRENYWKYKKSQLTKVDSAAEAV
ncbi:Mevalonate kinase [Neolecta irregularis DAH-3]|uniref:mevalonate kinase n=1 Tax=Neolecta irregularis (strain DAH-3) TaxID=1198029 RepID=A0A1U7LM88_NEOID|nr:Mevalonate kinase [Neolecta irregularis DAH-3]|eukprot:OLL23775.1 Mevalonate kinase [Neolecta irregularis DAH-3]